LNPDDLKGEDVRTSVLARGGGVDGTERTLQPSLPRAPENTLAARGDSLDVCRVKSARG